MKKQLGLVLLGLSFLTSFALAEPMTVLLQLKPRVSMEELARQVMDRSSPRYRQFYSPSEIRKIAAPDQVSYENLIQQLRYEGLSISYESKTHLWIGIQAEPAIMEHVFLTKFEEISQGRRRLAADYHIPTSWPWVEGLTGLDSSNPRHANHRVSVRDDETGVSPAQIKSIYGVDAITKAGINGTGQHIAIATYDNTNLADINTYYKNVGLNPLPVVDQIKFNGEPASDDDYNLETTMDAELSGMMAPGANIHLYTSAANDDAAEALMFTTIFDDNRSKIVNYSWSSCEKLLTPAHRNAMDALFQRAVAQGINVLAASGDTGAQACQGDTTLQAGWPSTSPYVVTVGGTTLNINGSSVQETGWGPCGTLDGCSGGGISVLYGLPGFQKNFHAPFVMRSYPDIAFNSDLNISGEQIWINYDGNTGWTLVGGTSMAAPQWSGLLALVGQARQKAGKGPVGFLDPILYSLSDSQRNSVLNDITVGTNGTYNAGVGWDAVTGLGSPKGGALLNFLVNQ